MTENSNFPNREDKERERSRLPQVLHRALYGTAPTEDELAQLSPAEMHVLVGGLVKELARVKEHHADYVARNPNPVILQVNKP